MKTAGVQPFPPGFETREIKSGDAAIHGRVGGAGPAVVMPHDFAETGETWAPLAAALVGDRLLR
jgi:hypothetical protein